MLKTSEDPLLNSDVSQWEKLIRERRIHEETVSEQLDELKDLGFSYRMISEMLNASVADVLRWQNDEATQDQHRQVRGLVALCDLMNQRFGIRDTAAWFETRLVLDCPVTPIELYGEGHPELVLAYAAGRMPADQVLNGYDPSWRDSPPSLWEVAVSLEGEQYIRMRGEEGAADAE